LGERATGQIARLWRCRARRNEAEWFFHSNELQRSHAPPQACNLPRPTEVSRLNSNEHSLADIAERDWGDLRARLLAQAQRLGFAALGISGVDLGADEARLQRWLDDGLHGEMGYMARHGSKRSRPAELVPGTRRIISVRMDYWPGQSTPPLALLAQSERAYIARYTLGRDYHKVIRQRLQRLAEWLTGEIGEFSYRVFTDSAPVLEKPIANQAGLGWVGKHTNLIDRRNGSWFFLGEMYVDLPLPADQPASGHCGSCRRCIDSCPTQAIIAPYQLDARRCISYLTIELHGSIPAEFRPLIGNRIFGCDDCQLVCPWNKFAKRTEIADFEPRTGLDAPALSELFAWEETEFLRRTEGSAIRRLGHPRWLRNIAVAMGNAGPDERIDAALSARAVHPDPMVREHVQWAQEQRLEPTTLRPKVPSALDLPIVPTPG